MIAKVGQQVRVKGIRGLWTVSAWLESPSAGPCARLLQNGRSRIIPASKLVSKSRRPIEAPAQLVK